MSNKMESFPEIIQVTESTDFVGLFVKDGKLKISVPKMLRFSDNLIEKKKEIVLFLNSINIAKTIEKKDLNKSDSNSNSIWPFDSYLWIIEDYLNNGFYFNREKRYVNENKGKIEWKRTMKNMPLVSNGNVIYDKFVTSKISPTNDDVANIYKFCLKLSSNRIGWLFNYNIAIELSINKSIEEMIYIVRKEMLNTFDDVKSIRFKHMLNILENADDNPYSSGYQIYGINHYYTVFEKMVDKYFGGLSESKKKDYNPIGHWMLNEANDSTPSSNLRPDTIFEHGDNLYILDSKMYKFGYTGDPNHLPETTSMQKQITYGDYVATKFSSEHIRNAFIIPYDKHLDVFEKNSFGYKVTPLDENKNISYIGYAFTEWRENSVKDEPYDKIYTFLIDLNYLLKSYRKKKQKT